MLTINAESFIRAQSPMQSHCKPAEPASHPEKRTDKWQPPSWLEDMKNLSDKDDSKIREISRKLDMGNELTPAELSYLSRKNPDMYKQASMAQLSKKLLEKRLERCRSREEVAKTGLQSAILAADVAKGSAGGETAGSNGEWTLYGMRKTYNDFHASKEYRRLPKTAEKSRRLNTRA